MDKAKLAEILARYEFANKESWTKRYDPSQGCMVTGDSILLQMVKNDIPVLVQNYMKLLEKVERLERIAEQARVVWAMCVNIGNFSNGVIWGGMDEGNVIAMQELDLLKQLLAEGSEN